MLAAIISIVLVVGVHAQGFPSFQDWHNAHTSDTAARPFHFEPSEAPNVCLRATKFQNCGTQDTSTYYYETPVTCCDAGEPRHDFKLDLGGDYTIGQCDWAMSYFNPAVNYKPVPGFTDVFTSGTFSFQCRLSGGADECGHQLCDNMIVTGYGKQYNIFAPSAFVDSLPGNLTYDPAGPCAGYDNAQYPTTPHPNPSSTRRQLLNIDGQADGYRHGRAGSRVAYPASLVNLYVGTFYVVNTRKDTKYREGLMEWAAGYEFLVPTPTPVSVSPSTYVASINTVKLQFAPHDAY